jgi:membrane fusion protein (multidrug efflux system)
MTADHDSDLFYGPVTVTLRAPAPERAPAAEVPASLPEADARQAARSGSQENKPADKPRKGWLRRHPVKAGLGLIAILFGSAAGYLYWDYAGHFESTDDAFIAARQFSIAPEVSGYITAVPVTDNQHVSKDGVVARIDQRQYSIALDQAEAQVTGAEDSIRTIDTQIATQDAQIGANQAQVSQAQANLELMKVTWGRDKPLVSQGWATAQSGTVDIQNLKAQQAAVESAQAALKVAQRQIDTLRAQRASADASLAQAIAQRDQAALNLSYTIVTADQPGHIANLSAAVGEFASAGNSLSMFVPDEIWVTANFKETQLDHMRPGQPATIEIDAYPDRDFKGHVASIQRGSGTAFSLLPAENATGNYVKIVQRVPVKIIIDNPPSDVALGPGMSVNPTVRVNPNPSLYEQLSAKLFALYERLVRWL